MICDVCFIFFTAFAFGIKPKKPLPNFWNLYCVLCLDIWYILNLFLYMVWSWGTNLNSYVCFQLSQHNLLGFSRHWIDSLITVVENNYYKYMGLFLDSSVLLSVSILKHWENNLISLAL